MAIDHFVSRFWRVVSIIAFGLTLLFTYRGLPDPTAVHFGETGRGDGFLPKEEVFYVMAGVVTFLNVLVLFFLDTPAVLSVKHNIPSIVSIVPEE
mgnify:CR=1 FL=1